MTARAIAAIAAFLAGCSLLVPIDSVTGGADPADAAAEGDAPSGDASAPVDSGGDVFTALDSSDDTDATPPFDCPANALVCDRFERDNPAGNGWTSNNSPSVTNLVWWSPTRSYVLSLNAVDFPWIQRMFATPPSSTVITFRLRAPTAPNVPVEFLKLAYGPANDWDTGTLGLSPDGIAAGIQTYSGSASPSGLAGMPVVAAADLYGAAWHLVRFEFDVSAPTKVVHVTFDGTAETDVTLQGHATTTGSAMLIHGASYRDGTATQGEAYVDDMVITPGK